MDEDKSGLPSWAMSSADSSSISLTIKGIGVMLIPLIITAGKFLGSEVAEADLTALVESIAVGISAIMIVVGLFRKLYYQFTKRN